MAEALKGFVGYKYLTYKFWLVKKGRLKIFQTAFFH